MRIINPSYEIISPISEGGVEELKKIELAGRTCYKSESYITEDIESATRFVKMIINRGHEAMLEHSSLTIKFICNRGVSHEIVRHRIASYAQESQRYCAYNQDKFNNEITVIKPQFEGGSDAYMAWYQAMTEAEETYFYLLGIGAKPEEAREVLPNSVKTELVMTANYREWRNFFKLRTDKAAHPQMREITIPLLAELKTLIPIVFDDIGGADGDK